MRRSANPAQRSSLGAGFAGPLLVSSGHPSPSRKSGAVAQTISQIRRDGTGHLANRAPWHKPSRKSDGMARAISQIRRDGTDHHANRTVWQKPSRKSDGMAEKGPPISGIGRHGTNHLANRAKWCHGAGFARFRAPFVPRRRICVMEGRDSAIPSDLRDGSRDGLRDGSRDGSRHADSLEVTLLSWR